MNKSKEILNELLVVVFNQILSIEAEHIRNKGVTLSMTEVHVLEAIRNVETPIMSHVAKQLRITVGTLTTSINILVKKGYVTREKITEDKRKVLLKLSKKAEPVLKIHDDFHDEMISNVIKDLSIDKNTVLIESLQTVSEYFKQKYWNNWLGGVYERKL